MAHLAEALHILKDFPPAMRTSARDCWFFLNS
jgi:hypothetical protein